MSCRSVPRVACLTCCVIIATALAAAEPPEFTQWQRQVEEDRINESLTAGEFDQSLTLAKDLVRDYRRAQERPRTHGGLSHKAALPQLLRLNFLLASTARVVGDQELARTLFDKIDRESRLIEADLLKVANMTQFTENMFEQAYLEALDQGKIRGIVNTARAFSQASSQNANAKAMLANAIAFHATLYDEFGALQLDAGKHRHAENLFRKSSQYWSYFTGASGGSSSIYRKHLRNYARLYTKDAELFLRDGASTDADEALNRAEAYLKRASERPRISASSNMPPASSGTSPAGSEPDKWEMADLRFNSGEYNVARSDQCGANDPTAALAFLDLAETDVLRALDILVELVPAGHPFLAFCFLELSGINARRVLYSGASGVPDCTSRSYARDMRAYWKRTQDIVSKTVQHKDNPVYRMLDAERTVCKRAQVIAKQFDDADCTGDAVSDTDDESSAEPFPHIGSKVRRGPDWDRLWADPDGGEGEDSIGTIVRFEDDGWIAVKWPKTGRTTVHRPGGEGRDDLVDLDGNAVAPRPVATDLSDGQSPFGTPGGGFSGRPGYPGGPMGPGGPPGLSVPTVPSGSSPPGYPSPGGDGTPTGASYPPGLAPVPGSAHPPGYGPAGSPSLSPPGYGPPGTSPSGTPGYGPPGSGSPEQASPSGFPSSGPPGPTPPGSVPPPSTVPSGSPPPAPQP